MISRPRWPRFRRETSREQREVFKKIILHFDSPRRGEQPLSQPPDSGMEIIITVARYFGVLRHTTGLVRRSRGEAGLRDAFFDLDLQ